MTYPLAPFLKERGICFEYQQDGAPDGTGELFAGSPTSAHPLD